MAVRFLLVGILISAIGIAAPPVSAEPLHLAARDGNWLLAVELIAEGDDVNAKDNLGRTPLHWAAESGNEAIAELLIESGADA